MTYTAQSNQVVFVVASAVAPPDVVVCNCGRHTASTTDRVVLQEPITFLAPRRVIAALR